MQQTQTPTLHDGTVETNNGHGRRFCFHSGNTTDGFVSDGLSDESKNQRHAKRGKNKSITNIKKQNPALFSANLN